MDVIPLNVKEKEGNMNKARTAATAVNKGGWVGQITALFMRFYLPDAAQHLNDL